MSETSSTSLLRHGLLFGGLAAIPVASALFFLYFIWPILYEPEVRFILPPKFYGGFIVIEDHDGTDLGSPWATSYEVVVPHSRVLKVKSFAPLQRWHTESIQIGDGPMRKVNLDPADQAVELRGGGLGGHGERGIESRDRVWYVLGTMKELEEFDPWPLFPSP